VKYIVLAFLLFGCSSESNLHSSDPDTFVFSVGDRVITKLHLYSNCSGVVTGYSNWADRYGNRTNVSFYCPNVGWLKDDVTILESSLIKESK
jgi:hypothetical protein